MSLTVLLLILAAALIVVGALRHEVIAARWRELFAPGTSVREPPPEPQAPPAARLQPHAAPVQKPAFHRSGKRH